RGRLNRAELLSLDVERVAAAGLRAPTEAPVSVLDSPGVPVVFGLPTLARRPC
ncbi:DUF2071 domain-containing protein, partial [Micromonospora sp. DH15]|nr:DUF2071 domain-containing protein [Micromonospora sp. DH15]